jgi:Ca2+-binding EF-hand superfamily protein
MKKLVLGMSAAALIATAAFAGEEDTTKMAAADTSAAAFTKLDADADGRVSAIEAANDSKVAAAFMAADADKDGYLSKAEFANLGKSSSMQRSPPSSAQPRSESSVEDPEATTSPR